MARKPKSKLVPIAIGAVVVVLFGGFEFYTMRKSREEAAELAAAWTIAGPACPTAAAGAAEPSLSHQTAFEQVSIAREVGGAAVCNGIRENGNGAPLTICQFITPGALRATTPKGTFSFAPPHGVDASLVFRDEVPTCVLHINPALFKD